MPVLPEIDGLEGLDVLVGKFRGFFVKAIDTPHDWEGLRREKYARSLKPLVRYLADEARHELVICALLALKWQFAVAEREDERGVYETRGLACELVAWRLVTYLSHDEALDHLCNELPAVAERSRSDGQSLADIEAAHLDDSEDEFFAAATVESPLMGPSLEDSFHEENIMPSEMLEASHLADIFAGLNALEIAVVADAKKFLRQRAIQRIVDGIWTGDIVFWDTLGAHSTKQARVYRKHQSDPYCRLRVPLYLKVFEAWFFAAFLAFYYTVLVQDRTDEITIPEIMLYVWLASFAYNELGEFWDAGSAFYAADFWSLWDVGIIATGIAFFITRLVGLLKNDTQATATAFNILSVEALFLVPRLCSLLSLHPYFGMLIPALKEMTRDFIKFLGLVIILYLGFTTCFAFLARGMFSFQHMNWILIKVFFGSSYLGFDISEQISPVFAPVLMVVFVALTNVLLITSMISLLSNTLTKVMQHARDEYLFVYAVYVLEASTSSRLTYFLPPLNLVPLLCLRPLRLWAPAQTLRTARIRLLKITHWPFVALILGYEAARVYLRRGHGRRRAWAKGRVVPWGSSASSHVRHASPRVSLLRRPGSRLAAQGFARSRLDEQARDARAFTVGTSDVHAPASVGRENVTLTTSKDLPPSSSTTDARGMAEMAAVVANLREQVEQLAQMMAGVGDDQKKKSSWQGEGEETDGEGRQVA